MNLCKIFTFNFKIYTIFVREIKSAQTYTPDFAKNLKSFAQRSENIESGYVVYAGDLERSGQPALINFKNLANSLD